MSAGAVSRRNGLEPRRAPPRMRGSQIEARDRAPCRRTTGVLGARSDRSAAVTTHGVRIGVPYGCCELSNSALQSAGAYQALIAGSTAPIPTAAGDARGSIEQDRAGCEERDPEVGAVSTCRRGPPADRDDRSRGPSRPERFERGHDQTLIAKKRQAVAACLARQVEQQGETVARKRKSKPEVGRRERAATPSRRSPRG